MRRILSFLIMLTVLFSMTACSVEQLFSTVTEPSATKPVQETEPTQETKPVQETEPTQETTAPEESEDPQIQPEETEVLPLSVLVGDHGINEYTEDYIPLCYMQWQSIILDGHCAAEYPKLAAALEQWNDDEWTTVHDHLEEILPGAKEAAAEMGEDFYGYTDTTVCSVQRADSNILSVRGEYDSYTGGLRPFGGTFCLNLDPSTGEKLTIDAILTDTQQLPQLLAQALRERYGDLPAETFDDTAEYLKGYSPEDYTWTLGYQGVTFYFGVSELAAGAVGELSAVLWFDQHPDLFVSKYTQVPKGGYAVPLSQTDPNDVDLNPGDGLREQIYVRILESGELLIGWDENTVFDGDYYGYYMNAYLVTPDNQSFYVYVDSAGENDYRTMYVYDLSGEYPECVTKISGDGIRSELVEDYRGGTRFTEVFNDPSAFSLSTRINILGSMTGKRNYHIIPAAGIPQPESDYYTLPEDKEPLTSKIPLEVLILPEEKAEIISAETKLYFLRSNNQTYVDMRLEDGRECRILITYRDWESLINGLPPEECFNGIQYAG